MPALLVANIVRIILLGLELLVLGRVVVSWVDPMGRNAVSAFIIQTSEPLLVPVRRMLPRSGMFDFSPLVVLLVLGVVLRAVA